MWLIYKGFKINKNIDHVSYESYNLMNVESLFSILGMNWVNIQ